MRKESLNDICLVPSIFQFIKVKVSIFWKLLSAFNGFFGSLYVWLLCNCAVGSAGMELSSAQKAESEGRCTFLGSKTSIL